MVAHIALPLTRIFDLRNSDTRKTAMISQSNQRDINLFRHYAMPVSKMIDLVGGEFVSVLDIRSFHSILMIDILFLCLLSSLVYFNGYLHNFFATGS